MSLALCPFQHGMGWLPSAPLSSTQLHPEEATQGLSQQHTLGYIPSPTKKDKAGNGIFFCLCFQHGLRLLAQSLCSPAPGKFWDSPALENILLARFQPPF